MIAKKGEKSYRVACVQKILKVYGLYTDVIDGSYGPKTTEAVRKLQEELGTPASGVFSEIDLFVMLGGVDWEHKLADNFVKILLLEGRK